MTKKTKEQLKELLRRNDEVAQKWIPETARWHMQHKPYQGQQMTRPDGGSGMEQYTQEAI